MRSQIKLWLVAIFGLAILAIASDLLAQDTVTCKVIKKRASGNYVVEINGKQYLAIPEETEKKIIKLKRDYLDAQREIVLKDSLLATYETTTAWYDTTLARQKAYIAETEAILAGYKGLLHDYKRLHEPFMTLIGGLGATGSAKKPAILAGLRIRKLLIWGFLQENNSGALIGTEFRLF